MVGNTDTQLSDGTMGHAAAAVPLDPVQDETRSLQYLDLLGKKIFPVLGQVLAVAAVVASAGLFGGAGIFVAGATMLSFEMGRAYFRNKADLQRQLTLYHDDIARVLDKSPSQLLTIADMKRAADPDQVGNKALKPLALELEHLSYRGKHRYLMAAVRATLTTCGAFLMSAMLSNSPDFNKAIEAQEWTKVPATMFYPLMGSLTGIGLLTFSADQMGKAHFESNKPLSVYHELAQLQEAVKQKPLEPVQVFAILAKLDKTLANEVRKEFHQPFDALTFTNKQKAVKQFEARAHAQALAQEINNGNLGVTAIALSAFDQLPVELPDIKEPEANPEAEKCLKMDGPQQQMKSFLAAYLTESSSLIARER